MKISDSDFTKFKSYVKELIDYYQDDIDNYDFKSFFDNIYQGDFYLDYDEYIRDERWLKKTLKKFAPELASKGLDAGEVAFSFLTQAICKSVGFENVVSGYIDRWGTDEDTCYQTFSTWEVDKCGTIDCEVIPYMYLAGINFNCDVHIRTKKIGDSGLYASLFNDHSLYIEEGCEEIGDSGLGVRDVKVLYLPKSLKVFEPQNLMEVKKIHYNGTSSELTQLLKNSG